MRARADLLDTGVSGSLSLALTKVGADFLTELFTLLTSNLGGL